MELGSCSPTTSGSICAWRIHRCGLVYWTQDLDNWNKENKAVVIDRDNLKSGAIGMPSVIGSETGWRCCTTVLGREFRPYGAGICLAWLKLPLVLTE